MNSRLGKVTLKGRVRLIDQQGNVEADTAADLGRRHQSEMQIDARRRLLQARSYWYPNMLDLHRLVIAIARFECTLLSHVYVTQEGPFPFVPVQNCALGVICNLASMLDLTVVCL